MKNRTKTATKASARLLSALLTVTLLFGAALPMLQSFAANGNFVLNGSRSAVYQLENGVLSGKNVTTSTDIPEYTGSGYVSGFLSSGNSVSFDVNVTKPGIYGLSMCSALYMENQALGKSSGQSSSHTQTSGDVTDGNPERGSYWGSGQPVTPDEPKWIQLDLGSVIPVHMIRVRIVTDWSARTQTFAVLGSTDGQNFKVLKDAEKYSFKPAGKGDLSGNYADAVFETAKVRYIRILFTGISDTGTNGAQVGELEVYSPLRSARLYLDGSLISEFYLDVDKNNIVAEDWDARVLSWVEQEIGDMALSAGTHKIEIRGGGALSGELNLDRITFTFKQALSDEAIVRVINLISALKPVYNITISDAEQILEAKEEYEKLTPAQSALIPDFAIEKLSAAVRRISLIGETAAIDDLVCKDDANTGGWSVRTNLQIGDISHGDISFTFSDIPNELWGCDWIRPAMESKRWNAGSTLVEFDVHVATKLYVAWDSSAPLPEWLGESSGFTKTDLTVSITNTDKTVFALYQKNVTANERVSLGYVGMDKAVYIVMLEHFTVIPRSDLIEDTTEYPVLDGIVVNDSANADFWSVKDNLQIGDNAYGDSDAKFTEVPEFLESSAWIMPAGASGSYDKDLLSVTVNRDGYIYLAVSERVSRTDFLAGYEKTEATLKVENETCYLYRKYVDAGSRLTLPAQNDSSPCYIAIMKTYTISSAPARPSISRFMAPFDTDGWYFVREGLGVGSKLFTNADTAVTGLPDLYRGCDYIQTYRDDKKAIYFYSERQIEIAVTVDSRFSAVPSWLQTWEDTGDNIEAGNRSYSIYTKTYEAGEFITIPKLAETSYDNYIVIVRPLDEGKEATNNPLVPKGEDKNDNKKYLYYTNDVFNGSTLPDGYTVEGGEAIIVSDGKEIPVDLAFRRRYTYSSKTTDQFLNATDGHPNTYWEAASNDKNSWIEVDLGSVKNVDRIVIMLNSSWADRTQTFSIKGSRDGASYTELVASKDHLFRRSKQNTVIVTLEQSADVRYIRICFTKNTGAPGAQVGELQVYGSEMSKVDKYVSLTKNGAEAALLQKKLSVTPNGKIIVEYKIRSSAPDRKMTAALQNSSGEAIVQMIFDVDGYIRVTNGSENCKLSYYRPDTWYTFKLVIDLENGSYDIWIDHLRKEQNLKTGASGGAESICFGAYEVGSILSVDNLLIYDNPEEYIFTEDFNGQTTVPDGWTTSGEDSLTIADLPFESDKSLLLTAKGLAAKASRKLPETGGLFSFEVKVKISGIGFASMPVLSDSENRIASGVAFYHNSLYAINGDNWIKVMDTDSPWAYYPANNWYKIRLVVNTYTKRYDVYVDGALRKSGLSFAEDVSQVSRVSFTLATDNTAYIDSLLMYMGGSIGETLIDTNNVIDVKKAPYNAKGDGVTDDTAAIQRALDDAAYTGKTVLLDNGVFLVGTIWVKSDTTLHISPLAKLLGMMEKTWYPLVESCEGLINYRQIGRGLILLENASNVRIEGGGTIDGNGFYGYRVNDPASDRRLSDARPCVILAVLSENVTIQNVNLINSAFWTLVPMESHNVTIQNVNINSMNTPNRDGIDPCDVINCTIENCNILAGDDGLCFKSSCDMGCANIDVRNMTIQSRSNGIKFGSDTYGGLKNLNVCDVTLKNVVKSGITMQSADGAEIERLRFERITMTQVDDPIFFSVGDRGRQPVSNPGKKVGYIRNVEFKDISYEQPLMPPYSYDADVHEVLLIGLNKDHKIENISFENVRLELPGGYTAVPDWPTGVGAGYPEHYSAGGKSNAWAYCIEYADNVTFKNCVNILLNEDVREEITYYKGYSDKEAVYDKNIEYIMPTRIDKTAKDLSDSLSLPDTVEVIVDFDEVIRVPVLWEADADYDLSKIGSYTYTGTLEKVDGVKNSQRLYAKAIVNVVGNDDGSKENKSLRAGARTAIYVAVSVATAGVLALAGALAAVVIKKKKKQP